MGIARTDWHYNLNYYCML